MSYLPMRLFKRIRGHYGDIARDLIGTITQVRTNEPVVALTFDDGPHPEYTPRLLDLLARYDARATLFMVGRYAEQHPEIVRRAAREGHAIANHTYSHPQFPVISSRERRGELERCQRALGSTGLRMFRPPYGRQTYASRFDLLRAGYQVVTWNVHAEDWEIRDPRWMAERLERQITPGSIVLLHDAIRTPLIPGSEDREPMLQALELTLERLSPRFRFISVPALMLHGRVIRHHWYQAPIPEEQFRHANAAHA